MPKLKGLPEIYTLQINQKVSLSVGFENLEYIFAAFDIQKPSCQI